MSKLEEILTRDRSSGRFHRRWRESGTGRIASFEGDNLDEAGEYDIVSPAALELAEPDDLCRRCMPSAAPVSDGDVA